MKKTLTFFSFVSLMFPVHAAILLVSPEEGTSVERVPENQKKIAAITLRSERLAALAADRNSKQGFFSSKALWRCPLPVQFKWRCTENETGPFKVILSTSKDFTTPHVFFSDRKSNRTYQTFAKTWGLAGNLETNRKYYWKVIAYDFEKKKQTESSVSTFWTEDAVPRWIILEGRVANVRDLGGYHIADGSTVRQGMLFRGEGLNNNSVDHETAGRNRLTVADQQYMLETLKIRTDLDLRTQEESAGLNDSPLGKTVNFINISTPAYRSVFHERKKETMANIFRVFCEPQNYPIYFHCIGGADRTGAVAFLLNGLLGVSQRELEVDWEHTFYPEIPDDPDQENPSQTRNIAIFTKELAAYGQADDSLQRKIELYWKSCGITDAEITIFRSIMLEKSKTPCKENF